ncbi:MAG: hypothetical protein CBE14_002685 [Rickettsiales bacterium TMED254]|nr:hypothetical protein [Rickettsiales bacterium]RPF76268.1 MAG: hypothetical protein CBE14_002685 [Rickettsiales bacterium TMED254]
MNEDDDIDWKNFLKSVNPIENKTNYFKVKKILKVKTSRTNFPILNENDLSLMDVLNEESIFYRNKSVDKNLIKKIKKGQIEINAKLDLHGFKISEAKNEVFQFINKCFKRNKRLLLIITGKGKRLGVEAGWKGKGILKDTLPKWLNSHALSKYIIWYGAAPANRGGEGALNVYLKKRL